MSIGDFAEFSGARIVGLPSLSTIQPEGNAT
jgi:hypothetical protein